MINKMSYQQKTAENLFAKKKTVLQKVKETVKDESGFLDVGTIAAIVGASAACCLLASHAKNSNHNSHDCRVITSKDIVY